MKSFVLLFVLCLMPAALWAGPAEATVEKLIAEAWAPQIVRAEWTFNMPAPSLLNSVSDWTLAEPRPTRMAGSVILVLQHIGSEKTVQRITVSGTARIFSQGWTARRSISVGQPVAMADLNFVTTELTNLNAALATDEDLILNPVAARMLVPGRPISVRDLKAVTRVHRGQMVELLCKDASVLVKLSGKAMQDGAVGDTIDVAVELGKTRRFKGAVDENGLVLLVR